MKIFVYGTLKSGHINHGLLGDSKLVGIGLTCSRYRMFCNGAFPMICKNRSLGYQITGELYDVDDETLARLDQLEETDSGTHIRDTTAVDLASGIWDRGYIYVWNRLAEYVLKNTYREIESGDWTPGDDHNESA